MTCLIITPILFPYYSQKLSEFTYQSYVLLSNLLSPSSHLTQQNLEVLEDLFWLYLPWVVFSLLLRLFFLLFKRAKQQKSGVVILLSLFQMFLPDPYAERTIKTVQQQKKKALSGQELPDELEKLNRNNENDK